ncbi:MAG: PTS sugar transporter subunit IIA [Longimicrobiales bacterium]|nr:PTS sugar transporter subunit IIA [Longimicrobiales bacterium]
MRLTEYLEPELVLTDLEADGAEDAIDTMVRAVHEAGRIDDPESVSRSVLARERSHTTSLGNGVALPHATVAGVDRARVLVAIAPEGIDFGPDDRDAEPDRLFFMLLSPLEEAGTHIKLLARIVRLARSRRFVETLLAADSAEAVIEEIRREDAQHV